jgi:hypothetical protein
VSTFSLNFDSRQVNSLVEGLRQDVGAASRPAAQAGAQLLYNEVRQNVARMGQKTGNLARSIYQVYSKDQSGKDRDVYHVSWNARKAPHGHLVEYGYKQIYQVVKDRRTGEWITLKDRRLPQAKQVPPKPFVRPAMAKFPMALAAIESEFYKRLKGFE